jgi:hypothetical protein
MSNQSVQDISLKSILLSDEQHNRLISLNTEKTKYCPCWCCSDDALLWCFFNSSPASIYTIYKDSDKKCCTCLDCCSWCFEFRVNKNCCIREDTICFLCCCSIVFV